MEAGVKGTVTSLASLFPAEETQKAARRVEEAIAEKQKELDKLNHFISDNNNIIKLVQRLPDELSHDVMVPFGKAAFFPGRLIHTNEILVFLGDGHYVERTSKQTVDILLRRRKVLDSEVDSLKAIMSDLKAEASFFDSAASEAAEGLVEIREEYNEELPLKTTMSNLAVTAKSDFRGSFEEAKLKVADDDDEEYARMMAKLDELEREELAAESVNEDKEADNGCSISHDYIERSLRTTQFEDLKEKHMPKDGSLLEKQFVEKVNTTEKPLLHAESIKKASGSTPKASADTEKLPLNQVSEPSPKTTADSSRAFTGSIVEHAHGLQTNPSGQKTSSQTTGPTPSKPVSRFKMQKGGR